MASGGAVEEQNRFNAELTVHTIVYIAIDSHMSKMLK